MIRKQKKRKKWDGQVKVPEYCCEFPDGHTEMITYNDIKQHNENIIEDNIAFGIAHPGDFSEKEVREYAQEAPKENAEFLKFLKKHPELHVRLDRTTSLYKAVPHLISDNTRTVETVSPED